MVKTGNRDNLGITFHISLQKHVVSPHLNCLTETVSNEGSQHMFSLKNKKKPLKYPQTVMDYAFSGYSVHAKSI